MKKKRLLISIILTSITAIFLCIAIPFSILAIRTGSLENDYSYLKSDEKYSRKVEIEEIQLVKQHISCGYATIEMMSSYYGNKVTEDDLSNKNNGNITTSSSLGFLNEINKSITGPNFVMNSYMKNDKFLKTIFEALQNNNPVAIEWAAKLEDEWTLHFSVVKALDIGKNNVTILNPYGYVEELTIEEFLNRTSFNAYKNMPLFLNFGFAFGAFDKNVVFYREGSHIVIT